MRIRRGTIRGDGKVFWGYAKDCLNGERWVTRDYFLSHTRPDWFEWRAAADERKAERARRSGAHKEQLAEWERTRPEREAAKRARRREYNYRRYHDGGGKEAAAEYRRKNRDRIREQQASRYQRLKGDPEFEARRKEALARYRAKSNPGVDGRNEKRARLRELKDVVKNLNSELREKRLVQQSELKALAHAGRLALKPPLTPEQRLERKREEKRAYKHRRRARLRGCEVKATPKEISLAREAHGSKCCYCGEEGEMTVDHLVPLASGGGHVLENIVFCCHRCNSAKRDLSVAEFAAQHDFVLDKWREK
jgi:5-methylcytosine-specific restriction endonuclease McrA